MSFRFYYRVDFDDQVYTYDDDYNWDIYDKEEIPHLFIDLGHHHHGYDPELWNKQSHHEIIVCTKDGLPMRGMVVEMHLEPTFDAYEKYPQLED